jgi:hypothetical protein
MTTSKSAISLEGYSHTQKAPLCLLAYCSAAALFVGAWAAGQESPHAIVLTILGIFTLAIGTAFQHLTVADLGDSLAIRFGPLPLFRKTVSYSEIQKVEVGRTLLLDGWGIHMSIRGGWVWNLWGRDCVVVHLKESVLRIGTDDAAELARFLEGKIDHAK